MMPVVAQIYSPSLSVNASLPHCLFCTFLWCISSHPWENLCKLAALQNVHGENTATLGDCLQALNSSPGKCLMLPPHLTSSTVQCISVVGKFKNCAKGGGAAHQAKTVLKEWGDSSQHFAQNRECLDIDRYFFQTNEKHEKP